MSVRTKYLRSTLARLETLTAASDRSSKTRIAAACANQGAFARWKSPDGKITPMALATLKRAANLVIEDGGWSRLDRLRRAVYRAAAGQHRSRTRTRSKDREEIRRLRESLDALRRDYFVVHTCYFDLLRLVTSISSDDERLRELLKRHRTSFSLNARPTAIR